MGFLWDLFNGKDKSPPEPFLNAIHEANGLVYLDDEYVQLGVSEGWLVFTGWYNDEWGTLVYTYAHRT